MRVIWLTWSFLTWLSAMLCGGGCLLPYWLRGSFNYNMKESFSDFGLFRRCVYPIRSVKNSIIVMQGCGYYEFEDVPNIYWKFCLILIAFSSCILFFLTFLLFILGFCLDLLKIEIVHKSCQAGQFCAGVMVLVSCILYPLGWKSNSEVQQICGKYISIMSLGRCHVGWAFVLTCAGGLLSLLSTIIPALLIKTGCNRFPNDLEYFSRHNTPSTTRDSIRESNDVTPLRSLSHNITNGTRYSYVNYQSLLGPYTLKSGNGTTLSREDATFRNASYFYPTHRMMMNTPTRHILPSTAASDSNKSSLSSKEHDS